MDLGRLQDIVEIYGWPVVGSCKYKLLVFILANFYEIPSESRPSLLLILGWPYSYVGESPDEFFGSPD